MKEKIVETFSEKETFDVGFALAKELKGGEIISLDGDLGVGKTVFSKGIGKGLGVEQIINSPTFSIVNEYAGRIKLYHLDVYRINSEDELYDIGFYEMADSGVVMLIEWAEKIREILPPHMAVKIEKDLSKGIDYRRIRVAFDK